MPIKIPKPSNKAKTSAKTPLPADAMQASGGENSIGLIDLLVDKIAITAKLSPPSFAVTLSAFEQLEKMGVFEPAKPWSKYEIVQLIALGGEEKAHVCFAPNNSYLPDLRLEFNPAKAGPLGMKILREILDVMLPFGGWDFLVEWGHVSRLDVAADIHGARMHHFHVVPQQVLATKTYEKAGKLKTIYIGKSKGNQLTVYSKSAEMADTPNPLPGPVVRIERRLKNTKLDLWQLDQLENPLYKFKVVAAPPGPPPGEDTPQKRYIWTLFLDSVARRTLGPALKLLTPSKMKVYRDHFKAYDQPWWDAEKLWAQWPETLTRMRLVHTKDWPE